MDKPVAGLLEDLKQRGLYERLTYRFDGRDFRLTDVHGRVVPEIVA